MVGTGAAGWAFQYRWDELDSFTGGAQWTISNVQDRLDVANFPWDDHTQSSSETVAAIGYSPGWVCG